MPVRVRPSPPTFNYLKSQKSNPLITKTKVAKALIRLCNLVFHLISGHFGLFRGFWSSLIFSGLLGGLLDLLDFRPSLFVSAYLTLLRRRNVQICGKEIAEQGMGLVHIERGQLELLATRIETLVSKIDASRRSDGCYPAASHSLSASSTYCSRSCFQK